ncbi:MAG: diguanylate cyclase [Magnetococcales bacterium]|nr:diguanylate cyclase [Magnetococcales bacterium]
MELLYTIADIIRNDDGLTILCIVVAFLAVFLTLEITARLSNNHDANRKRKTRYLGSLVLGLGLWIIHQVALSLQIPTGSYTTHLHHFEHPIDIALPLGTSLILALCVANTLLSFPRKTSHLLWASFCLGLGLPGVVAVGLFSHHASGLWFFNVMETAFAFVCTTAAIFSAFYLVLKLPAHYALSTSARYLLATNLLTFSLFLGNILFINAFYTLAPAMQTEENAAIGHSILSFIVIIILFIVVLSHYWHLDQERVSLEKSVHDLQLSQEIAHMGHWEWDLVTDDITWSNRLAVIFSMPSDRNRADLFSNTIHPNDRVDVMQCRRQARLDPLGQWSIRYRIICPNGEIRMIREHGRTLTNLHGTPTRLLATVANVTHIYDMEKREERVMQSQIALSALLETGLEPLDLEKQLNVALHIILTVPWLSIKYQGSIFLVDPDSGDLRLASHIGLSEQQVRLCSHVKRGHCLCGKALAQQKIVFTSHLDENHPITYPGIVPHGHYCVPIVSRSRVVGVLNLYVPHGYEKNSEEDAFLTTISNTLAGLIDLRHTQARLANKQEFITTILRTAPSLVLVLDQDGRVILFNHACQTLTGYTEEEVVGREIWKFLIPPSEVVELKEKLQGLYPGGRPLDHEGHWLTIHGDAPLIAWSSTAIATTENTQRHIVGTGVDISQKRRAEQQLRFLASHDSLTGLPNRSQFMEHLIVSLAQAKRSGRHLAVLFLDLDRFKTVNDTLGHEIGDRLLTAAASRIRSSVREMDVVARIGGDEFTVLMTGLVDIDPIATIAKKIITNIDKIFEIDQHPCHIGVSVGIGLFPEHGDDPQTLLKKADQAMYAVKESGRNSFKIWDETC